MTSIVPCVRRVVDVGIVVYRSYSGRSVRSSLLSLNYTKDDSTAHIEFKKTTLEDSKKI